MARIRRVGLTVKRAMERKDSSIAAVMALLKQAHCEVFVDSQRLDGCPAVRGCLPLTPEVPVDAIVALGGDGTILRAVRQYAARRVPFITVNRGRLGFLADMTLAQAATHLPLLLAGKGRKETRALFSVAVLRGGKTVFRGAALNEAVVAQGAIARLIELFTEVDGAALTTFRADGLIVSTPTGSTAYNLAAGGPVLDPSLAAMILTAINPHSFSHKPLVLPGGKTITVHVNVREHDRSTEVGLSLDGQEYFRLEAKDVITVRMRPKGVSFLRATDTSYFAVLREKLRWGSGPQTADA